MSTLKTPKPPKPCGLCNRPQGTSANQCSEPKSKDCLQWQVLMLRLGLAQTNDALLKLLNDLLGKGIIGPPAASAESAAASEAE